MTFLPHMVITRVCQNAMYVQLENAQISLLYCRLISAGEVSYCFVTQILFFLK